ncbi:hypothetical protein ACIO93_35845 [Streptomyces sp. NPDC087903]|uniref:hypothetical protein n=1 Tax=Streptomyces sp. NPDC087903 TaxID=3365819 RepID=UPI0038212FBD
MSDADTTGPVTGGPLIGGRQIVGPADSAVMRMLMAHKHMVDATLRDLTPASAQAARNALIELAKGVLRQEVDDTKALLAPALAQAAKDIADAASPTPASPPPCSPANSTFRYGRCTGPSPPPRSR